MILTSLFSTIIISYGLAVLLVEKNNEWPVSSISNCIKAFLKNVFSDRFSEMLDCTICSAFWAALIVDLLLYKLSLGQHIFLWPLSGFAVAGFTWTIYEFMNIFDTNKEEINEEDIL